MRIRRDHGRGWSWVVLVCLGCWGYEPAEAQLFHDDFHRPDSETIGKGWTAHRFPGRDSGLVVAGNRLTTTDSGVGGAVNRPMPGPLPLRVGLRFTHRNGWGGIPLRQDTHVAVFAKDMVESGYRLSVVRPDANYNLSGVELYDGDQLVTRANSTFQYGPALEAWVYFGADGSVDGHVTDGTNDFVFQFPPHPIASDGDQFQVVVGSADNRASALILPTVDDVYIHRGEDFFLIFPTRVEGINPMTAPMSSVFDHSLKDPYCPTGEVVAYTGERGEVLDPDEAPVKAKCGPLYSYQQKDPETGEFVPFHIAGNYVGTRSRNSLNYEGHPAYDYAFGIGTNVYAAADGIVDTAVEVPVEDDMQGRHMRISHFGGYQTRYLHLDTVRVKARDRVYIGQVIGTSGNSGDVAAHLHFEVRKDGAPVDPYGWSGAGPDPYLVNTGTRNVDLWRGVPALGLVSCVLEPQVGAERTVRLTWLTAWGDFEVESAPHLGGEAEWQRLQSTPVVEEGVARVFILFTEAARFFRLRPR
jgi:murein DD-endopeptidase MepM/ murein hydrolase activator NlpD